MPDPREKDVCRWCGKTIKIIKAMYGSSWAHEVSWRRECEPWHLAEPGEPQGGQTMAEVECSHGRPDHIELVRQLREALGMFSGAMSVTPQQAWEEARGEARRMAADVRALTRVVDDYEAEIDRLMGETTAVAGLHKPITVGVMAVACHQEDCDHDDSDGCNAAQVPTVCCAHCTSLREDTAHYEDAEYAVQPWPCPTAKALGIDGSGGTDGEG